MRNPKTEPESGDIVSLASGSVFIVSADWRGVSYAYFDDDEHAPRTEQVITVTIKTWRDMCKIT